MPINTDRLTSSRLMTTQDSIIFVYQLFHHQSLLGIDLNHFHFLTLIHTTVLIVYVHVFCNTCVIIS